MRRVTFDQFVAALVKYGEQGGYQSFNKTSGAMGLYQIMPGNWRAWAPRALQVSVRWWTRWLAHLRIAIASKSIPPALWIPRTTPEHQDLVARWRLAQMWAAHNGDCQVIAAVWESGNGNRATWGNRQIKYVNRVCVPLGYPTIPLLP